MIPLTPFDALETPLRPILDPRIFVQPKDKNGASETARQFAWVKFMRQHARQALVYAIPNGTHIASMAGRNKVQREGLSKGFPDTGALWAGGCAYLEWKDRDGVCSDSQIECLNRLVEMGYPCGVFRTAEVAVAWLADLGAPVPRLT